MTQELLQNLSRRTAQRICLRVDVGILDEKSGERALGQLCDLSATGACTRSPKPLTIGEELRLAFEYEPGSDPVRLKAEVVWCTRDARASSNLYLAGVRFTELSAPDTVRLREFIERKLRTVRQFLNSFELLSGLGEVEKVLISSVSFDRDLASNESLEFKAGDDTLVLVRSGKLHAIETDRVGELAPRAIGPGELSAHAARRDPRGAIDAAAARDGASRALHPERRLWYLWSMHAETALADRVRWARPLRESLLTLESGG